MRAWRIDDRGRFDFSDGDVRLEVKTASSRIHAHSFSYEQCNPPAGTIAVVASLLARISQMSRHFGDGIAQFCYWNQSVVGEEWVGS
jgi:hypothetical protein